MKKPLTRAFALLTALALLCGQTAYASIAIGSELLERDIPLADGVTLTENSLWSASRWDLRTERYLTYTPGGDVTATVYSGTYVASLNTVPTAAAALEAQGLRVVAAVNGGFFNSDGTLVGMMMTDGVLRSADVENYAMVGIRADGGFFVDSAPLTKTVSWVDGEGRGYVIPLAGFNAYRTTAYQGKLFLYNKDFSSRVNSGGANVSVLLKAEEGAAMAINEPMKLTVVSVADCTEEGAEFNGVLPEGCYLLYAEQAADPTLWDQLRAMTEGQEVTVSITAQHPDWEEAVSAVSGLLTLVKDGKTVDGLDTSAAPRTVLGIKADGTVVLYTIDGRQSGYSVGASYVQVADRLVELGCVTGVALDGGGSTTLGATLPGSDHFTVLNSPSGGAARRVNNTILLVAPQAATGELAGYYIEGERLVLAGSSVTLTATPYDTAGLAMAGDAPAWTAQGGTIQGDGLAAVYTAGDTPGVYQITAAGAEVQGAFPVRVVDRLASLTLTQEDGTAADSLTLAPGQSVTLTATGKWYNLAVAFGQQDVTWAIEGAIGSINGLGVFTAVNDNATGAIVATAGGKTVRIPVTVDRGDPFTDMGGQWSAEFVTKLYQLGITTGVLQADGSYRYLPNGELSRGQLLVFLTRLLGVDTARYEEVELPFADADTIPAWMLPSVRAMYALQVFNGAENGGVLTANVNSPVTREAAMTMLGRVLAAQDSCDLSAFADSWAVSAWARPYVETLVSLNIVSGSGGCLNPGANIQRGEAAKLLVLVNDLEKVQLVPRTA